LQDKKAEIFSAGRELFSAKGFKDTNISEVAKLAGMGVGTFYNYYSSKEELFLEVYLKENDDLKKRLMAEADLNDDPVNFIIKMVTQNISEMNSNRILKEWYNKELFGKLEKHFYQQGGLEKGLQETMESGMEELIRMWKGQGKLRTDLDDQMIAAILKSIPYIDLHKSDIGIQFFPQLMLYITEFVLKGLTDCQK